MKQATIIPTLHQWEEAGTTLTANISNYLDLSLSLGITSLSGNSSPADLTSRIDAILVSLQTVLNQKISATRSALAHKLNTINSPIHRLPPEVLSKIFMNLVFAVPNHPGLEQVESTIAGIYLALRNLLGVCKEWREIATNQGELWSLIPITDYSSTRYGDRKLLDHVLSYAAERFKGDLHLVATKPYQPSYDGVLAMLAPRCRSVNIATNNVSSVRKTMGLFLRPTLSTSLALPKIFIYQDQEDSYYEILPREESYIFPLGSQEQESFKKLSLNLSELHVRGAQLHWARVSFSQRLVALHLQEIQFGYDSAVVDFLSALSSATGLRDLKLISVRSYYNGPFPYERPAGLKIQLPELQNLLVDDLYFNTFDCFLSFITTNSSRLAFLLNWRSRFVQLLGGHMRQKISRESLHKLLNTITVHTFLLAGDLNNPWLSSEKLKQLVKCISPTGLETLWMNSWDLDTICFNAVAFNFLSSDCTSLRPINLHITCARIHDQAAFMDMITSHSKLIRQITLGAAVRDDVDTEDDGAKDDGAKVEWVPLREDGSLVSEVKKALPNIRLVDHIFEPPEFKDALWRLW